MLRMVLINITWLLIVLFVIVTCTLRGGQEATGAKALVIHREVSQ